MSKTTTTQKVTKKKFRPFKKIFMGLYRILDKLLITPISRVVYRINKIAKKHAGSLEGLLNKPHSLLLISLLIAVGIFALIDSQAVSLVETESELITGQPVNVTYNKEKYVVEGIPETVDIILLGRKSDLYLAKQLGDHQVVLDLSDYKAGEYTVKLKYNYSVKSVSYKLDPSSVKIKISPKVSSVKTLTYDLLNQDKLDKKLNVSEVKLNESEVYVKGSSETLERVATVKALIDLSSPDLELKEAGTFEIDKLPMVAYDESGKLVENVEIVPTYASGTIKVDSFFVELPVKVVPEGEFAKGYAIASATSSVTTVKVYGDQQLIANLGSISAVVDVDGLSSDKKFNVTLSKPGGVRYMSETTTTVNITVGEETTIELPDVSIDVRNLGSNYTANTVNQGDETITVILKGVESVIKNITAKDVTAYVDLSTYEPGVYNDVPVKVEGKDVTVTYIPKVKTVPIKISQNN